MIIFNADDFGLTSTDVSRVLFSLDYGVIKSTTVVPNYVTEKDLEQLNQKSVSSGLHVNLVQGKPLSCPTSLLGHDGELMNKKRFIKKTLMGRINKKDIEKEVRAQFEVLLDNRIVISHIDSHQNMHFFPQVLDAIVKVATEYHIKKIRALDAEYFWFNKKYSSAKITIKKMIIRYMDSTLLNCMRKPDKSILNAPGLGFFVGSEEHAIELWDQALKNIYKKDLIYEIPCHLFLSKFEFELYNSQEFYSLLISNDVEIGSFNNV